MSTTQLTTLAPVATIGAMLRPTVRGKFLYVGGEKFWVNGITYGTFARDEKGDERLSSEVVEKDFVQIAENGFNVVRTYTTPPRWVLDTALKNGLRVMVGISLEVQAALLDEPDKEKEIEESVRRAVRECSGHPAVFAYTIGNEIGPSIVRWYGRRRVERFLYRLYQIANEGDPTALVTYVNFPTTEYLQLPFLDFVCFNVYLESKKPLEDYIARLHSLSSDRPLVIAEVGLDSLRNGEERQAETLDWQIRTIFRSGCCGVVVYSWTDEWYLWGEIVEDWKFGLTTWDRKTKPSLHAVRKAFEQSPFPPDAAWPRFSVIVCSHNGAPTIRDTLDGLVKLDYPAFEVIVVNDGSTDATPQIAAEYPFKLINTPNRGLSEARNTGVRVSTGDIVAFIDDDAYPDVDWLRFLALSLLDGTFAGVGGPNLPPHDDGWKAEAVANVPGPNPVLLTDNIAEHIPGCNMAFKKKDLEEIGGFDPIFRAAGDDVDLCWRLRNQGGIIGFSPAAVVWHHRRNSFRKYWKQQVGYGKAEALLERKWPEKYNAFGDLKWLGRIYGRGVTQDPLSRGGRIYQGVWGTAPFQSLYRSSNSLWSLTLAPEWYLIIGLFSLVFVLTLGWGPSIIPGLLLLLSVSLPITAAAVTVRNARFSLAEKNGWKRFRLLTAVFLLHLLQPLSRLIGRIGGGNSPGKDGMQARPRLLPLTMKAWRYEWHSPEETLRELQVKLRDHGMVLRAGGEYDRWDLEVRKGRLGGSRLLLASQAYGAGKQLIRFRLTPRYSRPMLAVCALFAAISVAAGLSGAWISCIGSGLIAAIIFTRTIGDTALATGMLRETVKGSGAA